MDCIFYSYTYMYTYTRYDMAYTSPAPIKDSSSTAKTGAHVGATEKGAPAAPPSSITQHNQRRLTHPGSRHSARRSHWPRPPLATHSDCHSRLASQTHPAAHDTPSTSAASSATWAHWDRSPGATARHSSSGGHTLHSASGTSWRTNRIQVRVVVRPRCASVRNRHRHPSISRAPHRDGCAHSISRYCMEHASEPIAAPQARDDTMADSATTYLAHAVCHLICFQPRHRDAGAGSRKCIPTRDPKAIATISTHANGVIQIEGQRVWQSKSGSKVN